MATYEIKKILVPVDFSETAEKALGQAVFLSKKDKAEIILVYVIEGPMTGIASDNFALSLTTRTGYETAFYKAAEELLEKMKAELLAKGVHHVSYLIEVGKVYKKVVEAAEIVKADIIIMGTHGVSGFREFVIGSNTFRVVSEAKCPVLSIQQKSKKPGFNNILLPFRDKPHSREGMEYAIGLAKTYGATIQILGINTDPGDAEMTKIVLEAEQMQKIVEKRGVSCSIDVLADGFVSRFILSFAKSRKSDLIVMMSDLDRMKISEYVMGPVAQQLVNHSPVPILSIRPAFNPKTVNMPLIGDPNLV